MLKLQPEKISRVDVAFDHFVPVVDFSHRNVVSRLRKNSSYRDSDTLETIKFGSGDIVVRIYDKSKEIAQNSGKTWFHQLWGLREDVWRIEFQLRGEALSDAGIRTIDDFLCLRRDVLYDLATTHTSLRKVGRDMNRSRWQFHPLWLKMIETIEKLPRDTPGRAYNRGTDIRGRINKIDQSISGYLKARTALLALLHNAPPTNLDDAVDNLCSTLLDEINPIWFRDEVAERSKKYEVEL